MKQFVVFQVILYSLLSGIVNAQTEQWDTYMAKMGNKNPSSVLVDMGLMVNAPDRKYPNLVIVGPKAITAISKGIPDKDEIAMLEEILYASGSFLTGVTAKVLAGTLTSNCQRLNYYYVKDTVGIRNAMARMFGNSYKDYEYSLTIKPDPEWKIYRTFLYPDEAMQNWMENEKVITKMVQDGDTLGSEMEITFNLYFRSDTDRKHFADFVASSGYREVRRTESKKEPLVYGLIISRRARLNLEDINAITGELKKEARKHRGVFSNWDAQIKK